MTAPLRDRAHGPARPSRFRLLQPSVLLWLTAVWVLLWGSLTPVTVVGGFLVAVIACLVFPLPPLHLSMRPRALPLLVLVMHFAADVVVSSIQVARVVLRPSRPLRNAVVEVNLRTPSDLVLTVVAEMTCLIPGSLVVEARRATHTLYLHVLDVGDEEGVERFRQGVLDQETRVVRALGRHLDHLDHPPALTPQEDR